MFVFYIFVPFVVYFFAPLIFFRVPVWVLLAGREVYVSGRYVLTTVAACAVWVCLAAGLVLWPSTHAPAPRAWTSRALWWAFVVFSVLGSLAAVIHSLYVMPAGFEGFVHLVAFAPTIGVVLGLQVWRERHGRATPAALTVLVPALLLLDLVTALIVPVLFSKVMPAALSGLAILYGMSALRVPGRRQLMLGLVLIALLVASYPVKLILRQGVFGGPYIRSEVGANALRPIGHDVHEAATGVNTMLRGVAPDYNLWDRGYRFHLRAGKIPLFWVYALERVVSRINRLSDMAWVVRTTPASIPYAGGTTYASLPWKIVPRIVWPHRPPDDAGQFYGHRYGLLSPDDVVGSYNLPIVTEGWMNWGWAGVLLSAACVGVILRLAWWRWIGDGGAIGNVVIGMAVVGAAADMESNLSLVMGGVIQAGILYWIVEVAIRAWGQRAATARYAPMPAGMPH